eukprot:1387823-Pyramimonas_sp.AAC.1
MERVTQTRCKLERADWPPSAAHGGATKLRAEAEGSTAAAMLERGRGRRMAPGDHANPQLREGHNIHGT